MKKQFSHIAQPLTLTLSILLLASLVGCGKTQLGTPVEPPVQEVEQVSVPDTTVEESEPTGSTPPSEVKPADNATVTPEAPVTEPAPEAPVEEIAPVPSEPVSTETVITPDAPTETPIEDGTGSTTENNTPTTEEPAPPADDSSDSSTSTSANAANPDSSNTSSNSDSGYASIVDKVSDPNSPYFDPYDDNFDPLYVEGYQYDWGTSKYWPVNDVAAGSTVVDGDVNGKGFWEILNDPNEKSIGY